MTRTYGYCRISTARQKIDRQVDNILKQYPDAVIVKEIYTGTKVDRPEWKKLYKEVVKRAGSGEEIGGVNLWTDSNG